MRYSNILHLLLTNRRATNRLKSFTYVYESQLFTYTKNTNTIWYSNIMKKLS